MSDANVDEPSEVAEVDDGRGKIELVAAIMLGLAGLLTAYAAYYGGLAGGDAIKGYSQATISRNEANGYYADYGQKVAQDTNVFLQYQIQVESGNDAVAQVVRERLFSPELEVAYVAWNELTGDKDVPTPMDTPQYVTEELPQYQTFFDQSTKEFDEAAKVDDQGDNMDLAAVFLAVSLFMAGIAALFKVNKISMALLAGSVVFIFPGCWAIAKGKGWIS
ncbi:MAG: hypothetical protein JWN62_3685 [Acidimicrobiales bacterium]|nr:hypothetical protein [Acidimicrobiales bacterium]